MIWSIAWKNIWRNKQRSLVVMFSIVIGLVGGTFTAAFIFGMGAQTINSSINKFVSHIQLHDPRFLENNETKYSIDSAADIANYISDQLDSVKNKMQKERAFKAFKIVETEYRKLINDIKMMEDSLTVLRKLGINDYETQAEAYNVQLAIALSKNNKEAVRAIEDRLKLLGDYGSAYVSLRDELELEKKQLSAIKAKYEEAKVDAQEELPAKFVVDRAYKAERKSSPVRWVIVLVSMLSAFLLSVLTLIIIENFSKKKFSTINNTNLKE